MRSAPRSRSRSWRVAGSEMVRITVNTPEAARGGAAHPRAARPDGHRRAADRRLPLQRPPPADRLSGLRRGAVASTASTRATSARATSATASSRRWSRSRRRYDKPVRIGVNWGSLDQELLAAADGRERAAAPSRCEPQQIMYRGDHHARRSSRRGAPRRSACARDQIILSCKMSGVQDLISVYRALARRCDYALHLGLTEAGMGTKGTVASTAALARAAAGRHRRHDPRLADAAARRGAHAGGRGRARDPAVARPAHVQPERHRLPGLRPHHQHHVPGAGQADRRLPARADAGLEGALSRRREA